MPEPLLSVRGVSKRFGTVQALESVSLDFPRGQVHAVLGENGAGKSTLMGVIGGFVPQDAGSVHFDGSELPRGKPEEGRRGNLAIVHQHFMLVPEFTVAENLALATLTHAQGLLNTKEAAQEGLQTAQRLGWDLDPSAKTGDLPVGTQQRLEIAKALATKSPLLILDEPTAVLSNDEVDDLFRVIAQLRASGTTVILIAHKLEEIMAVADTVAVLRHGRLVASAPRTDITSDQLAEWMVGEVPPQQTPLPVSNGAVVARCQDLRVLGDRGEERVRGASLEARAGEVLGIGGVDGNGQRELAEALVGLRKPLSGVLELPEVNAIGYIPPDRKAEGLAGEMTVGENTLLGLETDPAYRLGPLLSQRVMDEHAHEVVSGYDVRTPGLRTPVASLSGGNQQKVVVGRALAERHGDMPALVVAVNPTRGLDVRATAYVRARLVEAASRGAAVVVISTSSEELAEMASRIVYLNRGVIVESAGAMVA